MKLLLEQLLEALRAAAEAAIKRLRYLEEKATLLVATASAVEARVVVVVESEEVVMAAVATVREYVHRLKSGHPWP